MHFNEKNVVIKNVLTDEEIREIYSILQNPNRQYTNKVFNQDISDFNLPDPIRNKIIRYAEEISGVDNLEISEYQFSRYSNTVEEDGTVSRPSLFPHFDETFAEPRFTFDYQIGGNTEWPIVVEGNNFCLNNNEALTFAGTHQVHWRTKKVFDDSQYIDMIFCHLRKIGAAPKEKDVNDIVMGRVQKYRTEYYNE